jgi:hypothetical protein
MDLFPFLDLLDLLDILLPLTESFIFVCLVKWLLLL